MTTHKRYTSPGSLWLIVLLCAIVATPAMLSADALVRTPWQIHQGSEPIPPGYSPVPQNLQAGPNGNAIRFQLAKIPAQGDPGWSNVPNDRINIAAASKLTQCLTQIDFTYFQTFVTVPAGTTLSDFKVSFDTVDDGARAYVFNSRYLEGKSLDGSDIRLGQAATTADLKSLIIPGEINRVVVVQFDDCAVRNNIVNALVANGTVTLPAVAAVTQPGTGWYRLQTQFQGSGKCLEGNQFDPGAVLKGSAFMDNCQNVSGQLWKFVAEGNGGYYRMKTQFQGENKCLEGNQFDRTAALGGGAFMDNCQNVSGQLWKLVPEANSGLVRLKSMFQGDGKCLEGNQFNPGAVLQGAAFMDSCQNVSGQVWRLVPAA